ncbi:hypothetical protein [Caulobacter sp. SSI4214]|uniref:P-type ATPase n=1 Tax=Caulobacter sp. SSI4214 TaxID=2575739 RepID=UPI0014391A00|nr:hypothetical protein [Caulobacter sp. SSI4214]
MAHDVLQLELSNLLPNEADACRRCTETLVRNLTARAEISSVDILDTPSDGKVVSIRFDGVRTSADQVEEALRRMATSLTERFGHFSLPLGGGARSGAAEQIIACLRNESGVCLVEIRADGRSFVEYDRRRTDEVRLQAAIRTVEVESESDDVPIPRLSPTTDDRAQPAELSVDGVEPARRPGGHKQRPKDHDHPHGGVFGERTELIFAIVAGAMLGVGWLAGKTVGGVLPIACYLLAYVFGGAFTVKEALDNLRHRRFAIDTLMLLAAIGAATLGQWAEGALLLFLFSLGHSLEHYAMGRARRAIEALAELAPETATVRRGDATEDIPVADLQIGDIVLVRPNERIAADGVVILGESSVNQAPVTGESVPVDKAPAADRNLDFAKAGAEQRVYAGTINGAGALDIGLTSRFVR